MNRKDAILSMRQVLIRRRDALCKALAVDLSLLRELASGDVEEPDSPQPDVQLQLAEVESRELARIEYALERMHEGSYGICEDCGNDIPLARLNALSYATRCIRCQRKAEHESIASDVEVG